MKLRTSNLNGFTEEIDIYGKYDNRVMEYINEREYVYD